MNNLGTGKRHRLHHEAVSYQDGQAVLEGYLVYDPALRGKRPGVAVVHEWWGIGPHVRHSADRLAALGYVALAIDMYGQGLRPKTVEEAGRLSGIYFNNRPLMRTRALAGIQALARHRLVDPKRLAAIGYCFGGATVLELARGGAPLRGVVSFHGALGTTRPAQPGRVKAKVLVLHGADDPLISAEHVAAFQDEMRKAGADWQLVVYGGAKHSFTNPAAKNPQAGLVYEARADRRSWRAMEDFFHEILS